MSAHELPPHAVIMQLASAKLISKPLYVVAKLGIADLLAGGARHVDELAAAAGADAPSLYRALRTLASVGVFAEMDERRFELTPPARFLQSGPGSMRSIVLWLNDPRHDHAWEEFEHSVRTGGTAVEKAYGMPIFQWLPKNPDIAAIFNDAMTNNATNTHTAVLGAYDFAGIRKLVDVGGGHGALMTSILRAHPQLGGVVFDMPSVVDGTRAAIGAAGLRARCQVVSGDFFAAVPQADAHIMSMILHDWDDARATALLRNIHRAQPAGGKLLVVEIVIAPGNAPSLGKLLDMEMLAFTGGLERSEAEYASLFASAGFELTRVLPTQSPASLLEAVRVA